MKFLLDTHVWLWLTSQPEQLSSELRKELAHPNAALFFSVASAWELGIKFAMGKIDLPEPPDLYVPSRLARDRIATLPIELTHSLKAAALPLLHKDPFDRLLVAQAQISALRLVTREEWVQRYDVDWLAA